MNATEQSIGNRSLVASLLKDISADKLSLEFLDMLVHVFTLFVTYADDHQFELVYLADWLDNRSLDMVHALSFHIHILLVLHFSTKTRFTIN